MTIFSVFAKNSSYFLMSLLIRPKSNEKCPSSWKVNKIRFRFANFPTISLVWTHFRNTQNFHASFDEFQCLLPKQTKQIMITVMHFRSGSHFHHRGYFLYVRQNASEKIASTFFLMPYLHHVDFGTRIWQLCLRVELGKFLYS